MKVGRGRARILGRREDVEPPPAVSARNVANLKRTRIGKTDDRSRMKSFPDRQASGEVLPGRNATDHRSCDSKFRFPQ